MCFFADCPLTLQPSASPNSAYSEMAGTDGCYAEETLLLLASFGASSFDYNPASVLTMIFFSCRVTGMRIKQWITKKLKQMLSAFIKLVKGNWGQMNLASI